MLLVGIYKFGVGERVSPFITRFVVGDGVGFVHVHTGHTHTEGAQSDEG